MTELPSGWSHESINSIVEGGMIADGDWVESKDQDSNGEVRLTQLADVGDGEFRSRSDRWMNDEQASRLNVNYLRPGDLLMARMPDPLGRTCMVPENIGRAVTVVDVAIIRITRKDVNPKFVMWLLNSPGIRQQIEMLASGTTRRRITRKNLGTINLPMPSFEEQNKIVELLEDHLSRLDAALADVKQAKIRAAQFRNVYIDNFLERAKGVKTTLGSVSKFNSGFAYKSSVWQDYGIPVVKIMNVKHRVVNLEGCSYITPEIAESSKSFAVKKGDLLFNMTGATLGAFGFYNLEKEARMNQRVGKFVPINVNELNLNYLAYFLEAASTQRTIQELAKGAAQPNISPTDILSLDINLPDFGMQNAIVDELNSALSKVSQVDQLCNITQVESKALRRSLLQAAFTGQLAKEVASV